MPLAPPVPLPESVAAGGIGCCGKHARSHRGAADQETDHLTRRSKKPQHKARALGLKSDPGDRSTPASATDANRAERETAVPDSRISPRTLLFVCLGLAVAWWIALGVLALLTANPVTLNREQILRSQDVVTGKVIDAQRGTVEVEKQWKQDGLARTIEVDRLIEAGAKESRAYIIPLEKTANGLQVTRSRPPDEKPLIYPATSDAAAQLTQLLAERSEPAAP